MNLSKLRILGSGYTEEEYGIYRLDRFANEDEAANFLSSRMNNKIYRPTMNRSAQKHVLEDKWVSQLYFSGLHIPVAPAVGLLHPQFGTTVSGAPLRNAQDLTIELKDSLPAKLVFKPRGGRKGRNIIVATCFRDGDGVVKVTSGEGTLDLPTFVGRLPADAFGDYDGGYHGWLVQHFLMQHDFMLELAPYAVNTFRVVTFIRKDETIAIHLAALRLGRKGSAADNWDKGGLSVFVDPLTGRLGQGVSKPRYGGEWTSIHPDSQAVVEGRVVPDWPEVLALCRAAAASLSGVRAVGWDVVLTPEGPVILEGNAEWGLPVVQIHTRGYLTEQVRADLAAYGAEFPRALKSPMAALVCYGLLQWGRSRGPRILQQVSAGVGRVWGAVLRTIGTPAS